MDESESEPDAGSVLRDSGDNFIAEVSDGRRQFLQKCDAVVFSEFYDDSFEKCQLDILLNCKIKTYFECICEK